MSQSVSSFQSFKLHPAINRALQSMNFETPTPIQAQSLPVTLAEKDLIGCAQTGTGKTAAFSIPILTQLLDSPDITALVLAPTRELAEQIDLFWKKLSQFTQNTRSVLLIGGSSIQTQIRHLSKRPRLIIATPGRLIDHLQRRSIQLSQVKVLVLDEADRMLDMGFAPQLSQILRHLPRDRQTLLFTATWEPHLDQVIGKHLKNPVRVVVGKTSQAAPKIRQSLIQTTHQEKNETLLDQLNQREGSILVFTRTQSRTDRVARYLSSFGVSVNRIHGGRTQGQRNTALQAFRTGKVRVLVATDIAARGIDVSSISHVINYDLPQSPEDYIHRIGRTGRAGATGDAVSFVTHEEKNQWREICKLLKKSGSTVPTALA